NGLIHRDIKPQNVLIDHYGTVKVTDFGIAVALSATALTQTNSVLGSVHYLSPEQARGGKATRKSDIYSLGIVFYELLTGKLPFSGQSPVSIALKHLQNETPSVREINPDIPQSVENIILKATAKDPFHRFQSVVEMQEVISASLLPENLHEPKYELPEQIGEETKAIPIITDDMTDQMDGEAIDEQTLIHQAVVPTEADAAEPIDENKKGKKPKKRKRRRGLIFLGLALLLIAFIFFLLLIFTSPKDVEIPDVVGLPYEEAVEMLEENNLRVNKETIFSEDIEEGHVVKTDPESGRTIKEKSTVDVYESEGKEKVEVKDNVGENLDQVKRILDEKGYQEGRAYDVISDKPIGEIVSQIQPEAGSEVVPEDTIVIFEVSVGPEQIALANLVGLTLADAKKYAEQNNLKLSTKEAHSDNVEKGKISAQEPSANTELREGSTVNVTISKGPEAKQPRSETVTFTVPFQPRTNEDGEKQQEYLVQICVGDMNEDITEVFHEAKITNDKEYALTLVIAENEVAEY